MLKRIAITGPESTGKSILAKELAEYFNTVWVPEYAREYLETHGSDYKQEDIVKIAKGQLKLEDKMSEKANEYLFCDTDLFVTKIWSEFKYGTCDHWILEKILTHPYDLHLLMDIDLEWEEDTLRENPGDRKKLFSIYMKELAHYKYPFFIIDGKGKSRVEAAIQVINNFFLYI
jgi:NadR type nicotinamide-nucleotide adenylyltransferase